MVTQEEPRWLTAEEQFTWQAYVAVRDLLEDHLDRQLRRDAGMPHMYYGLLVWLVRAPENRLRMTELAQKAKITRSRLSHAVARLEEKDWVRRETSASDGRVQYAVLTAEGHQVMRDTAPRHVAAVHAAVFDRLTLEQVRQLGEICEVIAEGLQPQSSADLPWLR